jgi:putative SOS response-associated peptidase YedK
MCGRIIQASPPDLLALKIVNGLEDSDNRVRTGTNVPPRFNGAPRQHHWVIRRNPQTGEHSLDQLEWGLIPHWCREPGIRPINAMAETVASKPSFRDASSINFDPKTGGSDRAGNRCPAQGEGQRIRGGFLERWEESR